MKVSIKQGSEKVEFTYTTKFTPKEIQEIGKRVKDIISDVFEERSIPSYYCKKCGMPPHNCLCSHEN